MISYLTLERDGNFIELFDLAKLENAKELVTFQSLLALYLHHQVLKGESSDWITYIRTLPESFTMPYFCNKSELFHLPESLLLKVVEHNETIKRNFQVLMTLLQPDARKSFDLETFKWTFFVCNSRSVYINGKSLQPLVDQIRFKEILSDAPNMALAPLLDLLNHSDQANTRCQLTHSESSIEKNAEKIKIGDVKLSYQLCTLKAFKKFEQIFINYGSYNNTKLLLEYGFTIPDNQMDFLEFSLEDINNYIKNHLELRTLLIPKHKYKFIRDHELDQQMYVDGTDGLNHNFLAVLAILLVPQNLYNLTQVAFGDELNFDVIKHHAVEIIQLKKLEFERFSDGLAKQDVLSGSGRACFDYFKESIIVIDKVLKSLENV